MKRSFLFLACAALLWTCVRDPLPEQPAEGAEETARFTVEEARTFVTGKLATTRTTPVTRSEADSLTSAWYEFFCFDGLTPQWEHAITGEAYGLDYVEAPFDLPHKYLQAVWDECDSQGAGDVWINDTPRFYPIPVRLHILRNQETNATAAYLCFYVPEEEFAEEFAGLDERKWAYPCSPIFSGIHIFTKLNGELVSAYKFERGECLYGYDVLSISSEDWTRLEHLVSSIYMARITSARTRGDDPLDGGDIDPVVIRPRPPIPKPDEEPKTDDDPEENENGNRTTRPGPGGGGTGNPSSTTPYKKNEQIKYTDPQVEKLLDQLMKDCFGNAIISALRTGLPITIEITNSGSSWAQHGVDGSKISITKDQFRDYVLMEELFHVVQRMRYSDAERMKMNMEVEAKFGWYLYLCRMDRRFEMNWNKLLGYKGDNPYFDMEQSYKNPAENPTFDFYGAFRDAVESLRTIKRYADRNEYRFDDTKMDMSALKALMIDC